MKCPYCKHHFTADSTRHDLGQDNNSFWTARSVHCRNEECKRLIVTLEESDSAPWDIGYEATSLRLVYPMQSVRTLSPEVPVDYQDNFHEACRVLPDSEKASAALSRYTLQKLLRDKAGVKHSNLANEIDEVLQQGTLPAQLAEAIDAVRTVGNFSTHPIKSTNAGEIVDVEPAEAEWLLDTLEGLFDFYFVQPGLLAKKRSALNAKLQSAGKPPLK